MEISNLSAQELRKAANLKEKIEGLQRQLNTLLGGEIPIPIQAANKGPRRRKRRKLSAQGLANIRAGVARRMGKQNGAPKKQRSAAWRKALSAALRKRWAKRKAQGKASL
jgi:hypothetical protein